MEQTAIQEVNEMFLKLTAEDFYGWIWNERNRLLELGKQQIVDAFVDGRNVGSKDHPGVDGNYYYEQVYK